MSKQDEKNGQDPAGIEAEVNSQQDTGDDAGSGSNVRPMPGVNVSAQQQALKQVRAARPHLTDMGNATRLIQRHGEDLLYCHDNKSWYCWTGNRWKRDNTGEINRRAKDTINVILQEAQNEPDPDERKKIVVWALKSESSQNIKAMIEQARDIVPVELTAFDRNTTLLNVANGTLDLESFVLRPHERADLITRHVPVEYAPDARAPAFEKFLGEILPSEAVRGWVQEYAGSSLTGNTRDRVYAILYGGGKNGKSTLVETLRKAVGGNEGYALTAAPETILAKQSGGIPNDVARLAGARFVSVSETDKDKKLAEGLVKQMAGGSDTISARFMRSEWFDFEVTHKVWLSTNHKPKILGTDEGIWDRTRLVPFDERFEKGDPNLPQKLEKELPGILAWMVAGCERWQRDGLSEPDEIMAATEEYRREMDILGDFIADCCVTHSKASVGATALYERYREWCQETGEDYEKQKSFGDELSRKGFDNSKRITSGPDKGKRKWVGIGLLSTDDDPFGGSISSVSESSVRAASKEPSGEPSTPKNGAGNGESVSKTPPGEGSMVHSKDDRSPMVHRENPAEVSGKIDAEDVASERSEPYSGLNSTNSPHCEVKPEQGSLHSLGSLEEGQSGGGTSDEVNALIEKMRANRAAREDKGDPEPTS